MTDTRCWRYRHGESRIFPSPEAVPEGEGWVDSPAKVVAPPVAPANDQIAAPEPVRSEADELRAEAEALGIAVDGRWGVKKLKAMIAAARMDG